MNSDDLMRKTYLLSPPNLILLAAALFITLFCMLALASLPAHAAPAAQIAPTAEACAPAVLQPTSSIINARTGPGPNYAIMTELFEGQLYPVVGRHHGFRWWAITLPDGRTGWVWDNIVAVSGNVDSVPLLEAPTLNGIIPDTQDNWTPLSLSPPCEPQAEETQSEETQAEETPQAAGPRNALASQDDGEQNEGEWTAPANLSNSGGASNPSMTVDQNGQIRIFWDDAFLGNFLVEGDHASWSQPLSVTVPFSGTVPVLLNDGAGDILSFWRDGEDTTLRFSRTSQSEESEEITWSEPTILDDAVLDYDAVRDSAGVVHVLYGRSTLTGARSAGVYYVFSQDQGSTWSEPALLFESSYFRSLRVQDAHVMLETTTDGGNVHLYGAWDVRTRKRVYLARSANGGQSWDSISEIAGPESTSNIILPFNLQVGAAGSEVLLVWQVGQPSAACQQFYQWSSNHGDEWSPRQPLPELLPGTASCPQENTILRSSQLFYLLSSFQAQNFLLAWNGDRWSEPQPQRVLTQFNNADTLNTVNLGCRQTAVTAQDRLYVAGCDTTSLDTAQSDVWMLSRSLGTEAEWFPSDVEWSGATSVTTGPTVPHFPQVVSDNTQLTHALWAQQEMPAGSLNAIFHSQWDGSAWTLPAQIMNSPAPIAQLSAVTSNSAGRVYMLWVTSNGEMYFSHAAAGQLQAAASWSPPAAIPSNVGAISSPAIAVTDSGNLYVAYAVAINERRGIYLTQSQNNGQTWTESMQLFDGNAAGWEIVGAPALTVAPDGVLHLLFDQRRWNAEDASLSTGLYYMSCADLQSSCSRPQIFVENEALWTAIRAPGQSTVHRFWQARSDDGVLLQHQVSADGGNSWGRASTLVTASPTQPPGNAAVAADPQGRFFAFATMGGLLQAWSWSEGAWAPDQSLSLQLSSIIDQELSVTVSQAGELVALYSDERPLPLVASEENGEEPQYALLAIERTIDSSAPSPTATITAGATPGVSATSIPPASPDPTTGAPANGDNTAEPEITPSPTLDLPPETTQDAGFLSGLLDSSNPLSFLIFSLVPVLLVVGVALVVGLRRRSRRHR